MHVYAFAGRYAHCATVHYHYPVDHIRARIVPHPLSATTPIPGYAPGPKSGGEIDRILSPGFHLYAILIAVVLHDDLRFDHKGAAAERLVGVDGHAREYVQAIVGRNIYITALGARQAVHVKIKSGLSEALQADAADAHTAFVGIIDL